MPLDPQVAQLLAWAARSKQPPWHEVGVERARVAYEKGVKLLDVAPEPLHEVEDLAVTLPHPAAGTDGVDMEIVKGDGPGRHDMAGTTRTLTVRRYVPEAHSWAEPRPALLFLHGGGFTVGSLDTHDRVCRVLARLAGCHVYAVDYRLAPEHPFPAAVDDAFDALAWLRAEAPALGVDASRIAVGGDSAGGTLAAACALHARDRGWALSLQLLIYPGLSPDQETESHGRFADGYLLDAETVQWFFGHYLRSDADRHDWRFAPLVARNLSGLAPACLELAEYDPLVDEGLDYAARLRRAGVPVECRVHEGMIHAFFQHGGFVPRARDAHHAAARALRRAFGTDHED